MEDFIKNFEWIFVNVGLAIAGVLFGFVFIFAKDKLLKSLSFILWIIFVPNTIYLITDIQYLPGQLAGAGFLDQVMLIGQYLVVIFLGLTTFVYGLLPFEKILPKRRDYELKQILIFLFNFLIAFGVVLGKIQRTHSIYVFTNPGRVLEDIMANISDTRLILVTLLFGMIFNLIYFSLKKGIVKFRI